MFRSATYLLLFLFAAASSFAQQIPKKGVPHLQNYTPVDYQNQGKIWDIDSAPGGLIYMAADGGLLEYDGKNWNHYTGSDGFTRSVLVVSDSLIYTGSDLDFGVWRKNRYLEFEYESLYPFREDLIEINEEFWEIHQIGENILFASDYNIYVYRNENLTKIAAPSRFTGSYMVGDDLYFLDEQAGLMLFSDLTLTPVFDFSGEPDIEIVGMYPHNNGVVMVTVNSGMFLYEEGQLTQIQTPLSNILNDANVFSFEQIDDQYLAVGTVQQGLYISDVEGNIVHYINRNKGLSNNTILSLHFSPNGQLWVGMDYGVSSLDLMGNMTYIYDFRGDFGSGYTAQLLDDIFYLGTNTGLYRADWEDLNNNVEFYRFDFIPGSEGQVWSLNIIDNELFVAHDRGLFIRRGDRLVNIGSRQGYWKVIPYKGYLLGGTYNGISIFEKQNGNWNFLKRMELIRGSANQLIVEKNNILWVNIPNYGIIRSELDESLTPTDRSIFLVDEFDSDNLFLEFRDDKIQVFTDDFRYTYAEADSGFTQQRRNDYQSAPENLMPWIYRSAILNSKIEFLPLYNGFAFRYFNRDTNGITGNPALQFRQFEAYNNEERIAFFDGETISHQLNNIRVEYLVPNQQDMRYQYQLNSDGNWSAWSPETELNLINLSYGNYTLNVRAMKLGEIYDEATLSFRIASPWYQSWYAYIMYLLLGAGLIYLLYLWQQYTLRKQEKEHLLNQQQTLRQQAEKHRRKILKLEQERLQEDYNHLKEKLREKTIELANKAKENEDKNRLIEKLKGKLKTFQKEADVPKTKLKEIQKMLDSYSTNEDNTFEIQMDQLHQDFYKRLMENFSQLSSNDLRLCAYLKLGFNSKEIAEFMNIQPSSVYINRSRLRKKLDLDTEQDLHEFLNSI